LGIFSFQLSSIQIPVGVPWRGSISSRWISRCSYFSPFCEGLQLSPSRTDSTANQAQFSYCESAKALLGMIIPLSCFPSRRH